MNSNTRHIAAAAVNGLIVIVGALALLGCSQGGPNGSPATPAAVVPTSPPSPSIAPQPTPTPIDPTNWVGFASDRYGYDIAVPPTWTATPATRDWSIETDREATVTEGTDQFVGGPDGNQTAVTAFSVPVPAGTSPEDWRAAYIAPASNGAPTTACTPLDLWEAVTVDGQPAMFNPDACSASQAFVFMGDRVYVFSVWREDQVDLLKAYLSTVRFRASEPATSPSASP